MTSKGRLFSWQGFSLAGLLVLAFFISTASADHSFQGLVSTGPAGGNGPNAAFFDAVSQDGTRAFFETDESLVTADTDSNFDVYERSGGTTTLISIGTGSFGNGPNDVFFDGISNDGTRVFFETDEKLTTADTDAGFFDIYQRSGGTTTLISTGGNGAFDAFFDGSSADGSLVFWDTDEQLAGTGDADTAADVYQGSGGSPTLVSTPGTANTPATYVGTSQSGTRVFFETSEAVAGTGDSDSAIDIFQRSGGGTTRLSTGAQNGNGAFTAFFDGSSADGTRVFFTTSESLESGDSDTFTDVYQRSGSSTTHISTGPNGGNGSFSAFFDGSSQDGTRVFFRTGEVLVSPADSDSAIDLYERLGGTTTLLSTGPDGGNGNAFPATFDGASADGTLFFFSTAEKLITGAGGDSDSVTDVYQRSGGTTTRLSTGSIGGNGAIAAFFDGASADGTRVFLATTEKLESVDTDSSTDIYERLGGVITTLLSSGPNGGNGSFAAFFVGSSQDGTRVFVDTAESLLSTDTDSAIDVYAAIVSIPYPRPATATPLRVALVPAFQQCSAPNSEHVAPLEFPSCSPPSQESALLTTSVTPGRGSGFARLDVVVGNPSTPQVDEADVNISASVTDVKNKSDGSDYAGKVILTTNVRITDKSNGDTLGESATVQDTEFSIPIDCSTTPSDPAIGSTCAITSTADTLVPGFAREGQRAVIEAFTFALEDVGANPSITPPSGSCPPTCGSGDEQVFLRQGIFAP